MDKSGFTLVELMIVVAIIAILSAIMLVNFSAARSQARDGRRISDIGQIQLAVANYFNRCDDYPLPPLATSDTDSNCPPGITLGTFISSILVPPSGTISYAYGVSSPNGFATDYVLQTQLENNNLILLNSVSKAGGNSAYNNYGISVANQNGVTLSPCNSTIFQYCVGPK